MKFPATTSAVFFFDVGRTKNCSFHTFAVIANLRLDTAPLVAALANYESDAVRLRSAASRLGCNADGRTSIFARRLTTAQNGELKYTLASASS